LNRRRWIAVALIALVAVVGGVLLWYRLTPLPSIDVAPAMRGTVAAQVYFAAGAQPGEDIASLDARILEVAGRSDDSWVCVGNWRPEQVLGMPYWRQEYAFNDNSALVVYSGGSAEGAREFDGVLIHVREPLYD